MAHTFHPKRKVFTPPAGKDVDYSELIIHDLPTVYFDVQSVLQALGVYLIAMNTGEIINGQVNVDEIGLTEPGKPPKIRHRLGYVQPPASDKQIFEKGDIDAVLIFNPNLQKQDGPLFLIIQAVRNEDVDVWTDLALTVTRNLVLRDKKTRALIPLVKIGISSLSQGNDAEKSAQRVALQQEHNFGFEFPPLISDMIIQPDEYFEDEDESEDD